MDGRFGPIGQEGCGQTLQDFYGRKYDFALEMVVFEIGVNGEDEGEANDFFGLGRMI